MTKRERVQPVEKITTGIPGLDVITEGGLPTRRLTLLAGTAGSGKTIMASHFIAAGIELFGEPGVFVTFEDSPDDIRRNMASFGWDIAKWEEQGKWLFVDGSPRGDDYETVVGEFDLGGLMARVTHAITKSGARRVSLDSSNALFNMYKDEALLRSELFRLSERMKEADVTSVICGERTEDYGAITRHGIEEFVADNVIILRNVLVDEKRRRTIEILKFRGCAHQNGEFPFTIDAHGGGMTVIPLSAQTLTQQSSQVRVRSGIAKLDEMCGGGFFRDSIVLVSGATGTGKTLTVTEFLGKGVEENERALLFAFEESREQLHRNAMGWGVDFKNMEENGTLKIETLYPHALTIEDHLLRMRRTIEEFKPARIAIDSLSALERIATVKAFREFVISLTSFIKQKQVVGLFTSTTPSLSGGASVTEKHISTLTDSIILLRYVENLGEMRRGLTVLKMRGSKHEKEIREFTIDEHGMRIGNRFRGLTGILGGNPSLRLSSTTGTDEMYQDQDPSELEEDDMPRSHSERE